MNTTLTQYINALDDNRINAERKAELLSASKQLKKQLSDNDNLNITFVCTHNSRRSQFAQVWAQVAASFYGKHNVYCFSGGTEVTAVYPMVVHTLVQAGLAIEPKSEGENPVYHLFYEPTSPSVVAFSKKYDHFINPNRSFIAIMTCSQADEACPNLAGAKQRIALTYEDPKHYDHTDKEEQKYFETGMQIANEMFYLFSHL